jgi:hypothetical protein
MTRVSWDLEDVENGPRTGRQLDFGIRIQIERALEVFPNGSVQAIAASRGYELSTVF